MAQLTDDCFAFSGPRLPREEMERLIVERVAPVAETEKVSLREAANRVLAADLIAAEGYDPAFGARPLKRAIQRLLENELARRVLGGEVAPGDVVVVDASDGELTFDKHRPS